MLTRAFPPEAVDAPVDVAGVREQRRRLLQPDSRGTITWKGDSPGGLMEAWLNFTRWLIKHRYHLNAICLPRCRPGRVRRRPWPGLAQAPTGSAPTSQDTVAERHVLDPPALGEGEGRLRLAHMAIA